MRALIGTDGSDDSVRAAAQALPLLANPDIVTVVCVAEIPAAETAGLESGFGGGIANPAEIEAAQAAAYESAKAALELTVTGFSTTARIEQRVEVGDAGAVLCHLAEELGADVVVVGSRGHGRIRRALLGSVSTHVANNAPCPVLIVRATG